MTTGTTTVFVGPSLPAEQVVALLPHARILPPVKHGDLLRLDPAPGDRVLIIDGLFLQTASVRHREILALLGRGVTVAGSSSMGALRAAELWRYGMRGYGEVFRLYRDGEIDGDDEVAVVHGVAEDGHRAFCDPLVAIRVALRRAHDADALTTAEAEPMLKAVAALPFRSRSFRALELMHPAGPDAAHRFQVWRSEHDTDLKAADARLLLRAAAAEDPALRPAGAGDLPVRNVHTWIFDMWEHEYHGGMVAESAQVADADGDGSPVAAEAHGIWVADTEAAAALRLFHPEFPEQHRRHVLSWVAGLPHDHPAVVERAVAVARERGLAPAPGGWLTAHDLVRPED
ncbi:MAG: hypothetical protein HOV83_13255, partial [Catenulispora sp.]|nr:hypothetical protein [Catenulispora sp.]